MFQYADKAVGDNGNMDLDADGILGFTPESLDLEMLLDPLVQLLSTEEKP